MKKIFFAAVFCIAYISNAQTLDYTDIGVLFSNENINGTARYNAMSGAFGALGGDISAIEVNPASAAVFLNSEFAVSLGANNRKTTANYYGISELSEVDITNLSQAGGVFVFRGKSNSDWGRIALGFNFSIADNYENVWTTSGDSGYAPISDFYDSDPVVYVNSDGQTFENFNDGRNNKYTFSFAAEYNDNLFVGASVSTFDMEHYQRVIIEENTSDDNGDYLVVSQLQELFTYGDGISMSLGIISKPNENIRLGLAYQSPVWYELNEDFVEFDVEVYESITDETTTDYSGINGFDYQLKTPGKITGSFAYIFEKQGLISIDYSYKNYSNIKLSNADFSSENQSIKSDLKNVGALKIGGEWRFENISLRGGYHMEKSPYNEAIESDSIEGFSLGAGYKFKGGKIDFSYSNSNNTAFYNFYQQNSGVNAAELDFDNSTFTATLVLNI